MKRSLAPALCVLLAACSSSNPPSMTGQDAGTDVPTVDTPVVADVDNSDSPVQQDTPLADTSPADAPMASRCGTEQPDVSGIRGTEGLVIGPDGTIYFSQSGGVGRRQPGMDADTRWLRITGAGTVWGLALDPSSNTLYVGSPSAASIYRVDLSSATPAATRLVMGAGQPNGLTLGPDHALWFTDFQGGHVFRVTADGMKAQVTTSPISGADGIAFGPDGALYVTSYNAGTVIRLELTDNMETARRVVARNAMGADGLNFDAMGRMYVGGGGQVLRYNADGSERTVIMGSLAGGIANVEFGVGALPCTDLYVASTATMTRLTVDTAGADVPWHRAR